MKRRRPFLKMLRTSIAGFAVSLMAADAMAQSPKYDADCKPKDYTAMEVFQQELCTSHIGCRLTMNLGISACKVKDFLSNLGGVLEDRRKPDNLDIIEALNRTEVPQTTGVKKTNASARSYYEGSRLSIRDRTNAAQISGQPSANEPAIGYLNRDNDRTIRWFEGQGVRNASNQLSGVGVQIESSGRIRAGIIINDAIISGGLARTPDASWAAGAFKSGNLEGEGYRLKTDGTLNAPVLEGTFKNNEPDGMMLATWPDFSSRKELWKDGKLIMAGVKVAKGQIPPDPKTAEEEAAEKAASEKAKFDADLAKLPNAGAINSLANEWALKGDMEKARSAWRSLVSRFPDSEFAAKAADLLGGGSIGRAAESPKSTGSYTAGRISNLTGEWRSETTGSTVYITHESGSILVSAESMIPDSNATRFFASGTDKYVHTFPDGSIATTTRLSDGRIEVEQPDFYDIYRRIGTPKP